MQLGNKTICRRCKYCWVSQNICAAYGSLKGYGCTMFEDSETHLKYPDYMKAQRYNTTQTNQKKKAATPALSYRTNQYNNSRKKKTYSQQSREKKGNY